MKKFLLFTSLIFIFSCNLKNNKIDNNNLEDDDKNEINGFIDKRDNNSADSILKTYSKLIKNDFWSSFRPTTKKGKKGAETITFNSDKYHDYMKKNNFNKCKDGKQFDYCKSINGLDLKIEHKGSIATSNGWAQKWEIRCQKNISDTIYYKSVRFSI